MFSHFLHLSAEGELGPDTTESSDLEPSSDPAQDFDGLSDNHMWPEVSLFNRSIFRVSSGFDSVGKDIFCLQIN